MREHLRRLWRNTGRLEPQLAAIRAPLPAAVAYLWEWFADLAGGCAPGEPISCCEIEAWQRLGGVQLTPWEFDTLRAMDRAALRVYAAQSNKARGAT